MHNVQLLKAVAIPNFFEHDVEEPVHAKLPVRKSGLYSRTVAVIIDAAQRRSFNRKYSFIEEACWPED